MRRALTGILAALLVLVVGKVAHAETRRIAVLVGSNRGASSHAALRFAERDAVKLSAVLGELGGLSPEDTLLLLAPKPDDVRAALDEAARRVAAWHQERRGQAVLLFYFSGHSDGEVLELASQSLPFAELRQRLASSGADIRLVIVDSCRSGALLAQKGGTLGQPFDIRLADDLASTGEALIASSAADESALESSEIGASFFSHHFVSGLRGGADLSGDGLVTLAEAFQYAAARTLRATSDTLVGPQHAAYDYHLAGRGELVLTELRRPSAVLDLPPDFDRLLLVSAGRAEALAELGPRSAHRIAVPAGQYEVRGWREGKTFGKRIELVQWQELRLASADLLPVSLGLAGRKGDAEPEIVASSSLPPQERQEVPARELSLGVGLGLGEGVASDHTLGMLRVAGERVTGRRRLGLTLLAATGHSARLRENRLGVEIGPSWWIGHGAFHAGLGIGVGAGLAHERTDGGRVHFSGLTWVGPQGGVDAALGSQMTLSLRVSAPLTIFKRDNHLTAAVLPIAWLALSRNF